MDDFFYRSLVSFEKSSLLFLFIIESIERRIVLSINQTINILSRFED